MSFQVVPSNRTGGNGHKQENRRLNIRTHFYCEHDPVLAQAAQTGSGVSLIGDTNAWTWS